MTFLGIIIGCSLMLPSLPQVRSVQLERGNVLFYVRFDT